MKQNWIRIVKIHQQLPDLFTQGKELLASKRHWTRVKGLIRGDWTQAQAWLHRARRQCRAEAGQQQWEGELGQEGNGGGEGKSRKKNEYEQKAWRCVKQETRCKKKLHNVRGAQRWLSKKTWEVSRRVRLRKSTGATREGLVCHANSTFVWWAKRPGFKSNPVGKWPDYKPTVKNNSIQEYPRRVYPTNTEHRLCTK